MVYREPDCLDQETAVWGTAHPPLLPIFASFGSDVVAAPDELAKMELLADADYVVEASPHRAVLHRAARSCPYCECHQVQLFALFKSKK